MPFSPPSANCPLCPRLAAFRAANRAAYADFHNAPVDSFGDLDAPLLIVGLAPGLKGANRTGRPFTGDYAGLVLYGALERFGFAHGRYDPEKLAGNGAPGDGLRLAGCRITNAVRCVPPQNKPEPSEIRQCNAFLAGEIGSMGHLRAILTLGQIAHKAVLMAFGLRQSAFAFGHGNVHRLERGGQALFLHNSYHCSRYNINTGVLTQQTFDGVIQRLKVQLKL